VNFTRIFFGFHCNCHFVWYVYTDTDIPWRHWNIFYYASAPVCVFFPFVCVPRYALLSLCVCIFVRFLCSQNSHVCQIKRKKKTKTKTTNDHHDNDSAHEKKKRRAKRREVGKEEAIWYTQELTFVRKIWKWFWNRKSGSWTTRKDQIIHTGCGKATLHFVS